MLQDFNRLTTIISGAETTEEVSEPIDDSRYAWYDPTCPCGLPAGECREHPRARGSQRPPEGEWSRWFLMAGRGFGKTKAGAEWVRWLAEESRASRIALVGSTAADVAQRDGRGGQRDPGGQPPAVPPGVRALTGTADVAQRGGRNVLQCGRAGSGCAGRSTITPGSMSRAPGGMGRKPLTC